MRALLPLLRRNPDFRRLYLAMVVSLLGDWFAFVAVSGLLTELTGRPGMPALVFAATVLPVVIASPLAGVLADRLDRRRLLIAADLARVPVALTLCLAAAWGSVPLAMGAWLLLALLSTFFDPVATAATPNLADEADLPTAQAAVGLAWGATLAVGAGLGGLVTATLGRQPAFVINAASFVVSALLVVAIRRPLQTARSATPPSTTPLREVRAFVRPRPLLRALLTTKAGVGIANGIVGLLPALAVTRFATGDGGVGLLLAARGLGVVIGPLLIVRLLARRPGGRPLLLACGGAILAYALAYALLPLAPTLGLAAACVMLAHLGGGAQWTVSTIGLQQAVPDALRGRVLALDYALATLAIGVSSLLAAAGAELVGVAATIWAQVGLAALYAGVWLTRTRPLWRRGAPDPLRSP